MKKPANSSRSPGARAKPTAGGAPANYRTLLDRKRRELSANLEYARFDTLARLGRVAEDDQAQITHEEFISVHRNSLDYAQLRLVEQALDRLNRGDFGVCVGCERPIAPKRLEAIPWAEYCVECQERASAGAVEAPSVETVGERG